MPARIRVTSLLAILGIIFVAFLVMFIHQRNSISDLDDRYVEVLSYNQYLSNKENELQSTLDIMDTDAFIEEQARTLYGYMKSDEIRFVITNPEELYGTTSE